MKRKKNVIVPGAAIKKATATSSVEEQGKGVDDDLPSATAKARYPTSEYRLLQAADEAFQQATSESSSFRISSVIEKIKQQFDCNGNLTADETTILYDRLCYLHLCALKGETNPAIVVREKKIKKAIMALSRQVDFGETTKKEFFRRFKEEKNYYLTEKVERKIEEQFKKWSSENGSKDCPANGKDKKDSNSGPTDSQEDVELKQDFQALFAGRDPDELPVNVYNALAETKKEGPLPAATKAFVSRYLKLILDEKDSDCNHKRRRDDDETIESHFDELADPESRPNSKEELKASLQALEVQWKKADDQVRYRFDKLSKSINKLCTTNTDSNRLLIQVLRRENKKLKTENQDLLRKLKAKTG
jgi:hypothetical protein